MATSAEQAVFEIVVNAAQAKRELNEVRQAAQTMGGSVGNVAKHLDSLGGKAGADARKAISSLGFAFGGVSQQAGQAIDVVGDLAGAVASGSALTIGITGVSTVVVAMASAWERAKREAEDFSRIARTTVSTDLVSLSKDIRSIQQQIDTFGLKGSAAPLKLLDEDIGQQKTTLEGLRKFVKDAEGTIRAQEKILERDNTSRLRARVAQDLIEKSKLEIKSKSELIREGEKELSQMTEKQRRLQRLLELEKAEEDKAKAKAAADKFSGEKHHGIGDVLAMRTTKWGDGSIFKQAIDIQRQIADAVAADNKEIQKRDAAFAEAGIELQKSGKEKELDVLRAFYAAKSQLAEEDFNRQQALLDRVAQGYNDVYVGTAQAAFGSAIGSASSFFDMIIKGEERAAEKATAAFLQSTGNQLVGIGTKAVFEGAAISLNPLTPGAGLPLMGLGAAAIVAGIGMGAGGTAIAHTAAGGTVGKALPSSKASTDRGVNFGKSGSRASGGEGVNINITYGAAGPAPEDTGREVERVLAVHRRRVGAR